MIRYQIIYWMFAIFLVVSSLNYTQAGTTSSPGCGGRVEGQQWNDGNCKICFCHKQSIMCGSICGRGKAISDVFQKSPTSESVRNNLIATALSNANSKGACQHAGKTRHHKESWIETNHHASSVQTGKECMLCYCNKRIVSCTIRFCPALSCKNPIRRKGSCCQYCPGEHRLELKGCSSFGSLFERGSQWKVYVPNGGKNECLSCSCQKQRCKSSLKCQRNVCPVLSCAQQVYRPGHCCKTCKDSDVGHSSMMSSAADMLTFESSSESTGFDLFDALKDSVSLTQHEDQEEVLEDVDCADDDGDDDSIRMPSKNLIARKREKKNGDIQIVKKPAKGPKDCDFGKIYEHGVSFIPERFECLRCSCKDANVTCGKVFCATTFSCRNPIKRKGVCCKVCPDVSTKDALKMEERDVRPLTNRRKSCGAKKEDRIQVFEYQSPSSLLNGRLLNNYFLFDRSQMTPPAQSEIHTLKFSTPNHVEINVSPTTGVQGPLMNKWKFIGSFKQKILERIHRHERNVMLAKSVDKFNHLVSYIKEKASKGKTNRRGARCERKSSEETEGVTFQSQNLFRTLKEV